MSASDLGTAVKPSVARAGGVGVSSPSSPLLESLQPVSPKPPSTTLAVAEKPPSRVCRRVSRAESRVSRLGLFEWFVHSASS